ncbi:unnamed protein product, partial [Menidia menidia]
PFTAMSSVQHLREFISQRLTAAAEEIFSELEKTIVQYEDEINRQRRLLEVRRKPRIALKTADLSQRDGFMNEEVLTEQLCSQGRTSHSQEGKCINQEEEQLVLHEDTCDIVTKH